MKHLKHQRKRINQINRISHCFSMQVARMYLPSGRGSFAVVRGVRDPALTLTAGLRSFMPVPGSMKSRSQSRDIHSADFNNFARIITESDIRCGFADATFERVKPADPELHRTSMAVTSHQTNGRGKRKKQQRGEHGEGTESPSPHKFLPSTAFVLAIILPGEVSLFAKKYHFPKNTRVAGAGFEPTTSRL